MELVLNGVKELAIIISFCLEGRQAAQPIRDGTGAVPYGGRDVTYACSKRRCSKACMSRRPSAITST